MSRPDPIRFAVVGAGRGRSFIRAASDPATGVRVVAVCDRNPVALEAWRDSGLKRFADYEDVLNDRDIDAVCLATPVTQHARQAISALDAGKHVLSEVTACYTLEEGWDLIAAVERSGRTYMMAENYCFTEAALQVQNMVELGLFGELTYAAGSYLHDARNLLFTADGDLTWRGELRRTFGPANGYPTHSLGPIARWVGVNRSDRLASTATWQSGSRGIVNYAARNLPDRPDFRVPGSWAHVDTVTTHIRTEQGVLIDLRFDIVSCRPHQLMRYELQGTGGAYVLPDGGNPEPLVWIHGRSGGDARGIAGEWEPLFAYREEFAHPLWREHREAAATAGHGGGDFFLLREFAGAVSEQRPPLIDVYDAVTWSSITPLSVQSLAGGGAPVPVPDFCFRKS